VAANGLEAIQALEGRLARQYPDLSLELINVPSARLREANHRIAKLTRTRPGELLKLYDQLT
jgi:hypothetical protein